MSKKLNKIVSTAVLTTMVAGTGIMNPEMFGAQEIVAQASISQNQTELSTTQTNIQLNYSYQIDEVDSESTSEYTVAKTEYKTAESVQVKSTTNNEGNAIKTIKAPSAPSVTNLTVEDASANQMFGSTTLSKSLSDDTQNAVDKQFIGWGITLTYGDNTEYQIVDPEKDIVIPSDALDNEIIITT